MKHLKMIMSVLVLLTIFSCTKKQVEEKGNISFSLISNVDIAEVTKANVSDLTTLPSSDDFTITIADVSSAQIWSGKVSEWDPSTRITAGDYTVTAVYSSVEEEGFDKPYFYGTQTFTVTGGQTSAVSVPVSLGNTAILVTCTKNFKDYFKDYSFKLMRDGSEIVTFVKGEDRAAFIDAYKFNMVGTFQSETGTLGYEGSYSSLDEATLYTFVFDVDNTGGARLTVRFNHDVETVNLEDYELND